MPPGHLYWRAALIPAAQAAGHTRDTDWGAQFRRMAARPGPKRAAVAVAHSILIMAYHLIRHATHFIERGGTSFDPHHQPAVQRPLIRRLEQSGLKVTVEPLAA